MNVRLFHGGIPGLSPGDEIVPHEPNFVDNCPWCEARRKGISTVVEPLPAQERRIYLTSDREYARYYASKFPFGDLYVVDAVGDLRISTEDRFPTWTADKAVVRSVYSRCVRLEPRQRRRLLRRWEILDRRAHHGLPVGVSLLESDPAGYAAL